MSASVWQRPRFYAQAAATTAAAGFGVALDGRPLRTPAGHPLQLPALALAEAVAAEWQAQDEKIRPQSMLLTQLAMTAIDRVGPARQRVIGDLLALAETDLLCHRADRPDDLVRRQETAWRPLLAWAERRWQARLAVTAGILPMPQPQPTLAALRCVLETLDAFRLTAVASVAQVTGSLIIALALLDGQIDAAAACHAALLDEEYQAERWGRDALAEARRERIRADITAGAAFLRLIATGGGQG